MNFKIQSLSLNINKLNKLVELKQKEDIMINAIQISTSNDSNTTDALKKIQSSTTVLDSHKKDNFDKTPINHRTIKVDTVNTSSGFDKVTARIKAKQMAEINKKLASVTQNELADLQCVCHNPQILNYEKKDFFLNDNFPYVALKSLQHNCISSSEFATLASLHAQILEVMQEKTTTDDNKDQFPAVFKSLFNTDTSINNNAWNDIKTLITSFAKPISIINIDVDTVISKMQQTMLTKSPIEAGFWIFHGGYKIYGSDINNISFRFSLIGVNLFLHLNRRLSIIPSISIRQEFLNAIFAEMSCNINPVIGVSKVIDLRNDALLRSRDFAIPFPLHPLPKQADGFKTQRIVDFQHHDGYHALRISILGWKHLKFYIYIGDLLAKLQQDFLIIKQELKTIIQKKISLYREFNKQIQTLDTKTKNKAISQLHNKLYKTKQIISALDNTRKAIGRFKFLMYDLDMPYARKQQSQYIKIYGEISFHMLNIIAKVNSNYIFNNDKFLTNFFFKITAKKIISFIYNYLPDAEAIFIAIETIHQIITQDKQRLINDLPNLSVAKQKTTTDKIKSLDRSIKFLQIQKCCFADMQSLA
jgi:hypothetical protein